MSSVAWNDFLTYGLQIGLLVGLAGWIPAAARLRSPKARLGFFQVLLAACVLLPVVRPWRSEVIAITAPVVVKSGGSAIAAPPAGVARNFDARDVALGLLAAGALARLGMLALGMLRLRRYRLRSVPLVPPSTWASEADIRISNDITGPVTFGFLRPVILLPAKFPDLPAEMQEAILCHETLHVRRCDWLFTAAEELVRAGLWFHPAIWWLLGEVQLAREQAVDHDAVGMTNAREPYVDALLTVAGAPLQADLAPAPLFLRKRHLKQRVVSILKEKRMSKTRTISTLAASLAILAGACWYVTGALPLLAQPQLANDSRGVTVDTMGAQLMHRAPVLYPREALAKNLEGVVMAQVKLDEGGNVTDASILSGPDDLRKTVLQSVLSWHFTKDTGGSTRQVAVTFRVPAPLEGPALTAERQSMTVTSTAGADTGMRKGVAGGVAGGVTGGIPGGMVGTLRAGDGAPRTDAPQTIRSIQFTGVGISADDMLPKLPVHVNDVWTPESMTKLTEAMHQIDEHLGVNSVHMSGGGVTILISAPRTASLEPPPPPPLSLTAPPVVSGTVTVGGRVQAQKLISSPPPEYPAVARQARISGTVEMAVIIGKNGHVQEIHVISGHPLLRQAALDAVKEWVYQPTLLNEQPVAVSTTVDVVFQIGQ